MAEMTAQEAAEWGKTLDFPTVWAALMEDRRNIREERKIREENWEKSREEIERLFKELRELQKENAEGFKELRKLQKENAEEFKEFRESQRENAERFKEFRESQKETYRQLGGLHNSMGDLIETLFTPHLGEKFNAYNYNLKRMYRRVPIYDENSRMRTDIDILLSNTTMCMAVEVKRWLEHTADIDDHIKRMHLIRQYPPAEVKGKKLLGAIVGAAVTPEAREYAGQNGFFVLELTGEDVLLLEPPKGFQPKEW